MTCTQPSLSRQRTLQYTSTSTLCIYLTTSVCMSHSHYQSVCLDVCVCWLLADTNICLNVCLTICLHVDLCVHVISTNMISLSVCLSVCLEHYADSNTWAELLLLLFNSQEAVKTCNPRMSEYQSHVSVKIQSKSEIKLPTWINERMTEKTAKKLWNQTTVIPCGTRQVQINILKWKQYTQCPQHIINLPDTPIHTEINKK